MLDPIPRSAKVRGSHGRNAHFENGELQFSIASGRKQRALGIQIDPLTLGQDLPEISPVVTVEAVRFSICDARFAGFCCWQRLLFMCAR